jgi:hypothetical protein
MIKTRTIKLALDDGAPLPTEFLLFVKGWNETENGRFLFDDVAAKSVMQAWETWGVDLMIDLEHQMLYVAPGSPDPTARDARGWCGLELRADGSLWAVNVRWSPDGAQRLAERRQRYVSPAFETDPKTKRVLRMINVAITAMPATHNTPALVAASVKGHKGMDPEMIKAALEAVEKGDTAAAMEILKGLIVAAAAGGEPDGDEPGAEGDGAEGVPAMESDQVVDPKVVANADDEGAPAKKDDDSDEPEKKAMHAMLAKMTGKSSPTEILAAVASYQAAFVTLEAQQVALAKQQAALDAGERRRLVAELVTLGAEFPATVWADQKAKKLKAHWASMPMDALRSHVATQREARGGKRAPSPKPAQIAAPGAEVGPAVDVSTLSAQELQFCKDAGADPKDYALLKAKRDGANARKDH